MIYETFNSNHIEQAARLALEEYNEEQTRVQILPKEDYHDLFCDMISKMINHNLGVAAIENNKVKGFMTCYEPWNNHFGTTMGTFSPIHAHGTIKENRKRIYSLLYQEAAKRWVNESVLSHAIALYAHDDETIKSFFWNGFGLRCIDAIRAVEPIICDDISSCAFCELKDNYNLSGIVKLKNKLINHLRNTPMFMPFIPNITLDLIKKEKARRNSRYFVAKDIDKIIGFIEIMDSGENFACDTYDMANICGAYLLPEYRSKDIYIKLLSFLMDTLVSEGVVRCGVDYESFNPTASGFWQKYFIPYTYSVARRIDERIVNKQ